VIGGDHLDPCKVIESSPECRDFSVGLEKGLGSEGSQRTDHFRLDRLDLPEEKGTTAFDLIRLWIPILRGAAFDDIRDVNLFPLKMNGLEDPCQKLPGSSNKGPPLYVFVVTGALSDDHQSCLFIPLSKDKGVPSPVELAPPTIPQISSDFLQGF